MPIPKVTTLKELVGKTIKGVYEDGGGQLFLAFSDRSAALLKWHTRWDCDEIEICEHPTFQKEDWSSLVNGNAITKDELELLKAKDRWAREEERVREQKACEERDRKEYERLHKKYGVVG